MIDPKHITNFRRSDSELQSFWLFCIMVAGRNSDFAARCVGKLLSTVKDETPFSFLRKLGENGLRNHLVAHRVGQYVRIHRAINESLNLDLRRASVEDLMKVFGIGPKTARFFVLHSREGEKVAVLDVHILKWLRDHQVTNVPQNTPQNPKEYARLEMSWLGMIRYYYPNCTPAQADLLIWLEQSGRLDNDEFTPTLPFETETSES